MLQGIWLTLAGVVLGLALSYGLTRFIARLLYGVSANEPITVFSVVALLGGISLLACFLPAHRAMHANPVSSIRDFYAFEQHVKVGFERRGELMPQEWYEIPVYYQTGHHNLLNPLRKTSALSCAPGAAAIKTHWKN